jgi:hypothetical protein
MMTLQQIIDIPQNRRVHLDFDAPQAVPTGEAWLSLTFHSAAVSGTRRLGTLKHKGSVTFAPDYKMTEEELLGL